MSRKRTHVVNPPKDKKKGMRITFSAEEQLKWERAARREAQIESGTYVRGAVHGGDNHARNKRDRREGRQQTRNYQLDRDE